MDKHQLADDVETRKRSRWLNEFLNAVIDPEEQPAFVSDDATIFDISSDDREVLSQRCVAYYGAQPSGDDWQLPLWQLLDKLYAARKSR